MSSFNPSSSEAGPPGQPPLKKSLQSSEWLLIGSLILILLSFVLIAKVTLYRASSRVKALEAHQMVEVTVKGAVVKSGTYPVVVGTPLGTVLRKARPKATADLKEIDLKRRIEATTELEVGELKEMTVTLIGEVMAPGDYTFPVGARIHDLSSKISFTPDADPAFTRRKRLLKNGEVLRIPQKKKSKKKVQSRAVKENS